VQQAEGERAVVGDDGGDIGGKLTRGRDPRVEGRRERPENGKRGPGRRAMVQQHLATLAIRPRMRRSADVGQPPVPEADQVIGGLSEDGRGAREDGGQLPDGPVHQDERMLAREPPQRLIPAQRRDHDEPLDLTRQPAHDRQLTIGRVLRRRHQHEHPGPGRRFLRVEHQRGEERIREGGHDQPDDPAMPGGESPRRPVGLEMELLGHLEDALTSLACHHLRPGQRPRDGGLRDSRRLGDIRDAYHLYIIAAREVWLCNRFHATGCIRIPLS
jgi:hypothetical protein